MISERSPLFAIDGKLAVGDSGIFMSENDPQPWLQLDFGTEVIVRQVVITTRIAYCEYIVSFKYQFTLEMTIQ